MSSRDWLKYQIIVENHTVAAAPNRSICSSCPHHNNLRNPELSHLAIGSNQPNLPESTPNPIPVSVFVACKCKTCSLVDDGKPDKLGIVDPHDNPEPPAWTQLVWNHKLPGFTANVSFLGSVF
jgi:hypothetical protein